MDIPKTTLPALDGAYRRPVLWAFHKTILSAAYFIGIFTDLPILTAYPTAYPMGTFMKLPILPALPTHDRAFYYHYHCYCYYFGPSSGCFIGIFMKLPFL